MMGMETTGDVAEGIVAHKGRPNSESFLGDLVRNAGKVQQVQRASLIIHGPVIIQRPVCHVAVLERQWVFRPEGRLWWCRWCHW